LRRGARSKKNAMRSVDVPPTTMKGTSTRAVDICVGGVDRDRRGLDGLAPESRFKRSYG
jgi:hypothetical protein